MLLAFSLKLLQTLLYATKHNQSFLLENVGLFDLRCHFYKDSFKYLNTAAFEQPETGEIFERHFFQSCDRRWAPTCLIQISNILPGIVRKLGAQRKSIMDFACLSTNAQFFFSVPYFIQLLSIYLIFTECVLIPENRLDKHIFMTIECVSPLHVFTLNVHIRSSTQYLNTVVLWITFANFYFLSHFLF